MLEWSGGDGRVALDVVPLEVLGALTRLRLRLLRRIDALPASDAELPTRCTEWRAVDLVNHLADTTQWASDALAAAAAGQTSIEIFAAGFDPVATPKRLTDAVARDLDQARARLHAAIDANLRQVPGGVLLLDRPTPTPLGPQPLPVALLHLLWDTWLHERDMFLGSVPEQEDEVRLCAIYTLRMLGLMFALRRRERSLLVELRGATDVSLRLDVRGGETVVRGVDSVDDGVPILRGDAATVVDALTGRGDVDAALDGPAEARRGLSSLSRLLAGR
jgi:hypothetical protein